MLMFIRQITGWIVEDKKQIKKNQVFDFVDMMSELIDSRNDNMKKAHTEWDRAIEREREREIGIDEIWRSVMISMYS